MSRRSWALFIALSVLWGVPYLMIRVAVADFNPVVVAFGRTALGGLLLLPVALYRRELAAVLRRWRHLLLYTACEIIGPWWLLSYAETRLDSSTSGLLVAMVPLLTAVILVVAGRDRFGLRRAAGLVIGFGGVAVLVGADLDLHDGWAVAAAVGTVIGYAFGAYMMGHLLHDLPPIGVITGSLLLSAIVYLPFAIWFGPQSFPAPAVWSVVGLAVLSTALGFLCMFALVAEAGASRATVVTYINPAIAIVLGVLVLSEPMTLGLAIGFPLVILGAVLATSRGRPAPVVGEAVASPAVSERRPSPRVPAEEGQVSFDDVEPAELTIDSRNSAIRRRNSSSADPRRPTSNSSNVSSDSRTSRRVSASDTSIPSRDPS